MTGLLIAAVALLWLLVAALALVVLALARQVGVLHERLAPVGALTLAGGVAPGEPVPPLRARLLDGERLTLDGPSPTGRMRLLLFVSETCPVCKKMIPLALAFARAEHLDLFLAGDDAEAAQQALATRVGVPPSAFLNGPEAGLAFGVGRLPYAVLLDASGLLAAKGLVNSREHLESLTVSHATGHRSLQAYLQTHRPARASAAERKEP